MINNIFNQFKKWLYKFELYLSLSLLVLGFLWFTPLKSHITKILTGNNTNELPFDFWIGSVTVILGVIIGIIHRSGKETVALTERLEELKHNIDTNFLHYGTNGIYADVDTEIVQEILKRDKIEISVLAYTLFSVTPKFQEWKERGVLHNITFHLYHLDIDFINSSPHIDPCWAGEVEYHLKSLARFKEKNQKYLEKNKIEINIYPYHHIPAVHGFKLNTASFYISSAVWDEDGYIMAPYNVEYEKITIGDKTKHARHLRKIFNNWLTAARESDKRHKENQNRTDEEKS